MISNVRLRLLALNRSNEWEVVETAYDGPELNDALTVAIRGGWSTPGVTPLTYGHVRSILIPYSDSGRVTLKPGLRLDITVRGQG